MADSDNLFDAAIARADETIRGYPNTALVGVQVDSEQFGSQQVSRNYHLRGRILQVPSNYNPQT
ncbi:head-tail joining protein, partial [Escherichia coli]